MGPGKRFGLLSLLLTLAGCGNNIPAPPVAQWVCFKCSGMTLNGDGSFTFPDNNGVVGYIYTARSLKQEQIIALTFSLSGNGTISPSAASGSGPPQLRLFLWEKGDDLSCAGAFGSYRWWSNPGAAPLEVPEMNMLSVPINPSEWTNCNGQHDTGGFANAVNNLLGVGFTFGAEYFGHGVYANGSVNFKINNFTVQ